MYGLVTQQQANSSLPLIEIMHLLDVPKLRPMAAFGHKRLAIPARHCVLTNISNERINTE